MARAKEVATRECVCVCGGAIPGEREQRERAEIQNDQLYTIQGDVYRSHPYSILHKTGGER